MAILFADDFKGYGTSTAFMLNGLYAEIANSTLSTDPDPSATGVVFQTAVSSTNGIRLRRIFPANYTTAGFAFRVWLDALPTSTTQTLTIGFSDASNTGQIFLSIDTTGRIVIRGGASFGTVLATTAGPVIVANAYNHIEMKSVASATVGSFEVRVNGVPVLTGSSLNTGTQYSQFRIDNPNSIGSFVNWYFKDLVLWNTAGTHNNDFLGTVSVIGLVPSSDVSLNWTPSTGTTGFNLLDNSPPVDGTDYISAGTPPPSPALFNIADLPTNVTSVRALITQIRARKVDGGDGTLQTSLVSSGDTANGADRPITTAFTYYEDVFEVDPHTSASWTPAATNAATLKINRTT